VHLLVVDMKMRVWCCLVASLLRARVVFLHVGNAVSLRCRASTVPYGSVAKHTDAMVCPRGRRRLALSVWALVVILCVVCRRGADEKVFVPALFGDSAASVPCTQPCAELISRIEPQKGRMISKTTSRVPFVLLHMNPSVDTVISRAVYEHGLWDTY